MKRIVFNAPRSKFRPAVPWFLRWGVKIKKQKFEGKDNYVLSPKNTLVDHHLIYYHGGHYINECEWGMYLFVWKLVRSSNVSVTITDYPLAPENDYRKTHDWAMKHYQYERSIRNIPVSLLGDSAGGGLALALAQQLREDRYCELPSHLFLLCPWLDMVQSDLDDSDDDKCLLLQRSVMQYARDRFSDGDDYSLAPLSPINGSLEGIGKISIWYGTEEIMAKSVLRMHEIANAQNIEIDVYEGTGQHHEYFLLPVPEQSTVLSQIKKVLE